MYCTFCYQQHIVFKKCLEHITHHKGLQKFMKQINWKGFRSSKTLSVKPSSPREILLELHQLDALFKFHNPGTKCKMTVKICRAVSLQELATESFCLLMFDWYTVSRFHVVVAISWSHLSSHYHSFSITRDYSYMFISPFFSSFIQTCPPRAAYFRLWIIGHG